MLRDSAHLRDRDLIAATLEHVDGWPSGRPSWVGGSFGPVGQLSGLSPSGRPDDLTGQFDDSLKEWTHPAFAALVEVFPGLCRVAVNVLGPGGGVRPHREPHLPVIRWHLPVVTNPEAVVWVDGRPRHLPVGEWWPLDVAVVHAAVNHGSTDRVHLIVDVPKGA